MNTSLSTTTLASAGGASLFCQSWPADSAPAATLTICHGLGDHSGRFDHAARYFAERNFAVFAVDLRGHGRSPGKRGHVNRFQDYLDDVKALVTYTRNQNPSLPLFLWGHSMGGLIALTYALNYPDDLSGVIASAPALRDTVETPGWKTTMGKMLSNIYPSLSMSTGLDPNGLSHNQDVVNAYNADPLVHGVVSARWYTEYVKTQSQTMEDAPNLAVPSLILHGADDPIVDPDGSKEFFERVTLNDKQRLEYPGLLHEVHNEAERLDILADIEAWLAERVTNDE